MQSRTMRAWEKAVLLNQSLYSVQPEAIIVFSGQIAFQKFFVFFCQKFYQIIFKKLSLNVLVISQRLGVKFSRNCFNTAFALTVSRSVLLIKKKVGIKGWPIPSPKRNPHGLGYRRDGGICVFEFFKKNGSHRLY